MNGSDKGTIIFLLVLIAIAVVLVDDVVVRVAMSMVPALLLAQRAVYSGGDDDALEGAASDDPDRRADHDARREVGEILSHFREFYTTCHLFGQERLSATEAKERTAALEKKLNQTLARMTSGARTRQNLL